MKKWQKGLIAAGVCSVLAVSSFAAGSLISIDVDPSIRILVNGEEFQPKDANGNDVMTFTYNGTTYAPLRALAEAYGLEVGYDADRKMATVDGRDYYTAASIPSGTLLYEDEYVSISYSDIFYSDSWLSEGYHMRFAITNKTDTSLSFLLDTIGIDGISYSISDYSYDIAPNSTGDTEYCFADNAYPTAVTQNINGQMRIYDWYGDILETYSATFNYYY